MLSTCEWGEEQVRRNRPPPTTALKKGTATTTTKKKEVIGNRERERGDGAIVAMSNLFSHFLFSENASSIASTRFRFFLSVRMYSASRYVPFKFLPLKTKKMHPSAFWPQYGVATSLQKRRASRHSRPERYPPETPPLVHPTE